MNSKRVQVLALFSTLCMSVSVGAETLKEAHTWKKIRGTGPGYSLSCDYRSARLLPDGTIEISDEPVYDLVLKAFGSVDTPPEVDRVWSVGEIYIASNSQRVETLSNEGMWEFDPKAELFEHTTRTPEGEFLEAFIDFANNDGGIGVHKTTNVFELGSAEVRIIGAMVNCESIYDEHLPRHVLVSISDHRSYDELSDYYGDDYYESMDKRLDAKIQEMERIVEVHIKEWTEDCVRVVPSKDFCGCLASNMPAHIDFDEYLEITTNEHHFIERDRLGADQPIESFRKVLSVRDACQVD